MAEERHRGHQPSIRTRPQWLRYGVSVGSIALALAFTLLVPDARRDPFFTLFTLAVGVSTWIGGKKPGILAFLLGVAVAGYLFASRSKVGSPTHDVAQFSFFVATAFVVTWLIIVIQSSQQKLRESEARVRTLAEAVPQMLWSTDAAGNADYLSQQWLDYTGQTLKQAMASGWQDVLHPEERETVSAIWRRSVESGEIYEIQCRLRRADGVFHWMLARGVPLRDGEGRITKWFGTCTDIDKQRKTEESLRRAEKLAAAGHLASTMAHNINNPLESVINLLFLAKEDPSLPDGACRDCLVRADQELARVTHIVRQTLGLFVGSSSPAFVSIPTIVNELLAVYAGSLEAKKLCVDQRLDTSVEPQLVPVELRQVFAALLANAIDASPMGGTVRLRVRIRHDWNNPEQLGLCVSVGDQGVGIKPSERSKIFEPFFTTKTGIGTGLGLWGAKDTIDRWNGKIRFRSSTRNDWSGTMFSFFIPLSAMEVQASASSDGQR